MKLLKTISLLFFVSCASKPLRFATQPSPSTEKEIQSYVKEYLKDPNYSPILTKEAPSVVISMESTTLPMRGYCVVSEDIRELVLNIRFWRHGSPEYRYKMVAHGLTQCLYHPRKFHSKLIRKF